MRSIILLAVLAMGLACLSSCAGTSPGDAQAVGTFTPTESKGNGRFTIVYQGGFLAGEHDYKTYRAVYIITDSTTGEQYLGIEGVGVSGLKSEGKNSHAER